MMIYLDSNATTQVHPEVVDAMLPYFSEFCYNPSSGYRAGKKVKKAIEQARDQVASLISAKSEEIVFTGCGTESNNAVLLSLAEHCQGKKIITGAIEHSAVLRVCEHLAETQGYEILKLGVDSGGVYQLEQLKKWLQQGDVAFVSLMLANNETGVLQPIQEAADLAHEYGVPVHTDAIQAVGKIEIDAHELGVDFLSLSGHKFHAPKGVGAIYIRSGVRFNPLLLGGGQEKGRRSGTENVASLIGLGKAAELMQQHLKKDQHASVAALRDQLETRLMAEIDGVTRNGDVLHRTANTAHLSFSGCDAAGLLILLDEYGVACSAGSACMTGKQQASHVQRAMGIAEEQAKSSLRISLSIFTTEEEINTAVEAIKKAVKKLRSVQGLGGMGPVVVYT